MPDPRRTRLAVEPLEGRCVPTVITVTGTGDGTARDGVVTLREAILAADSHRAVGDVPAPAAGPVTIKFNIPGGGLHVIRPSSGMPTLDGGVTIDATSQPGYRGTPLVQLDGSVGGPRADALTLLGGHNAVRGLLINNWGGRGIVIASDNNVLTGDWVGVDATGYRAAPNGADGIVVAGASNLIGDIGPNDRMVVSGNRLAGIDVSGARTTGNLIINSYIGTDASGFASVPNGTGILVQNAAHNNQIGGWVRAARNVVTGNTTNQIRITGAGASGNVVQGNYIGADSSGESAAQGGGDGILIDTGAANNLIGGTALGTGNLIAGIGLWMYAGRPVGAAIELSGRTTTGNVVQGNWIGLDARGGARLIDTGGGIRLTNAGGNTLGGKGTGQNVISDQVNSSGVATAGNNMLPGNWYFDTVRYIGHPERLGGSFRV